MPVEATFAELDSLIAYPRASITEQWAERLFQTLNALYEAIFDEAAPDASSQTYAGHNHGRGSGAPIIRNSIMCMDAGYSTLFTLSVSGGSQGSQRLTPAYVSHGLATQGQTVYARCAILYKATGDDFLVGTGPLDTIYPLNRRTVNGSETNKPQWATFPVLLTRDGQWVHPTLYATAKDGNTATLSVYAINLIETYQDSQPILGLRKRPASLTNGNSTVIRFFYTLDSILAASSEWGDSGLFKRIYGYCNALYEAIFDESAYDVAAADQGYSGHDHTSTPGDSQGGRGVGRGMAFSAGGTSNTPLWTSTTGSTGVWNYADTGNTYRRTSSSSTPGGTVTTASMFRAWVNEEITSSGNPPSSAPYMTGWILVGTDNSSADLDVRLYNIDTGDHSATLAISPSSTTPTWYELNKIPCSGGSWNNFAVEVKSDTHSSVEAIVYGITIGEHEFAHDNETPAAQVPSSGGSTLGAVREGTSRESGVIRRAA